MTPVILLVIGILIFIILVLWNFKPRTIGSLQSGYFFYTRVVAIPRHLRGADPRIAPLVVAVATSNSFVLPTHQVNALIIRPGSYRTIDFVRAGIGMTLLYRVVMVAAVWAFFGIH